MAPRFFLYVRGGGTLLRVTGISPAVPIMPILLYHGPPAAERSIRSRVERGVFEGFLVIVPTRRRMRHLLRSVPAHGGRAAHALQVHTLETLALQLFPRIRPDRIPARGILPSLLYQQAIRRAGEKFAYFTLRQGPFPLPQGTFATITSVLTHLRETGVGPDALEAELPGAEPDEVHKLADVISMARAYEEILDARGAVDTPGVFQILSSGCSQGRFTDAFREFYPHVDLICASGFDEFTGPEIGLLTKLRSVEGAALLFTFDFVEGNQALFGHLEENVRHFQSLGLRALDMGTEELAPAVEKRPHALEGVVRSLFAPHGGGKREDLRQSVTVVAARTRREEVNAVCRLLKSLLLDSPEREPGRICVAMINPAAYTVLFRHAAARYGIPVNITDRFPLSRAPVVTGIMGLLRIIARDFMRDDVLRVMSRPEFRPRMEGRLFDTAALDDVSGRLKITGGYASWIRRIERRLIRLRSEGELRGRRADERATLEGAREDLSALHDLLLPLSGALAPAEFQRRLAEVLERLGLLPRILRNGSAHDPGTAERESRAYARFLSVVEDVCAFLAEDPSTGGPHPPAFYIDQLTVALSAERFNVREEFGRGVLITAIEETRGLPIDVMILIGLVDGEFPSVYQAEVFYSIARQKRRARRHSWEQRYLFYQAVTNWSEHLYLFHPLQEDDCELVRSTFLDSLLAAADVRMASPAGLVPGTALLSETEALRMVCGGRAEIRGSLPGPLRVSAAMLLRARGAEAERSRGEEGSPFTGTLGGNLTSAGAERLAAEAARVYSVSQLEGYARCPFRFFGERVLGVRERGELVEELDPLERGNLLHAILCVASLRMRAEGLPPLWRARPEQVEAAERILLEAAAEKLAELEVPDPFWNLDCERLLGGSSTQGILREYIAYERGRTSGLTPAFFEVAFGGAGAAGESADPELSQEEPVTIGGIRLRGKVDRVETGEGLLAVIDYKTGRSDDNLAEIRRGRSLQLPLYLLVISRLLERKTSQRPEPAAGFHYVLRDDVSLKVVLANEEHRGRVFAAESKSQQVLPDGGAFSGILEEAVGHAGRIVEGVAAGRFPLTAPEERTKVCPPCPLRTICRVQTARPLEREQQEES